MSFSSLPTFLDLNGSLLNTMKDWNLDHKKVSKSSYELKQNDQLFAQKAEKNLTEIKSKCQKIETHIENNIKVSWELFRIL